MRRHHLTILALFAVACSHNRQNQLGLGPEPEYAGVTHVGGAATVVHSSTRTFGDPAPNLTTEHLKLHEEGDVYFEQRFVPGPGSGHPDMEGLGPVYNNTSCKGCHLVDGRGALPYLAPDQLRVRLGPNESILLRMSIESEPEKSEYGAPRPVPGFSDQLFHRGVLGVRSDVNVGQADIYMHFRQKTLIYPDGTKVQLHIPVFEVENPYDAPSERAGPGAHSRLYQADVRWSPRLAPPMIGLGLLEAIRDQDILALADPEDLNHDGIRGKPNWVFDVQKSQQGIEPPISLGRFGWKGSTPNIAQQAMAASNHDMGVTNFLFPVESIFSTDLYRDYMKNKPAPTRPEMANEVARAIIFYTQTLGVPARRDVHNPQTVQGARLFAQISCNKCHTPSFVTGESALVPEFSNQKIYPFTDMLLHDMGEDLADHRRDFDADGRQWKTRPLWGIGLSQSMNMQASFLHDGRARTLEEAILFHGGEAARSRADFMNLSQSGRDAIIHFLDSL